MGRTVTLAKYYPNIMKEVREFQHIAEVENDKFNTIWKCVDDVISDEFVESLTSNGCSRWESILKLHPSNSDTLAARRKKILIKINTILPYTHRSFQNMLNAIYGTEKVKISLDYNQYKFWMNIAAENLYLSPALRLFAREIIPANLSIAVRNTQSAKLNLYAGVTMQRFKHMTIQPSTNFTIGNSPTAAYAYGGSVKRMIHIILRS